jgi:DNA-binding MarR family transcriptional regulator
MDMSELQYPQAVSQILEMVDRILQIEKRKHVAVEGVELYPSEIHLMLHVADEQSTNLTRIAERLGITKGALSQTLGRLERKGMLLKSKDPQAKNELTVSFTPEGQRALKQFRALKSAVEARYDRYLAELDEGEREAIGRFLARMNELLGGRG